MHPFLYAYPVSNYTILVFCDKHIESITIDVVREYMYTWIDVIIENENLFSDPIQIYTSDGEVILSSNNDGDDNSTVNILIL